MNNFVKITFLFLLICLPCLSLLSFFDYFNFQYVLLEISKTYILKSLKFSFIQSFISALVSILGGILVARALFYLNISKKVIHFLYIICILPNLIIVFGLISFYGNNGFIQKFINFQFYGINAILLAHIFLNLPFASLLLYKSLQSIPSYYHDLNLMLNINKWSLFKNIEFFYLKEQIFNTFVLIFILCFSSFTIVLTLGASPKYSTLEVLIYHALHAQYDFTKVSFLSLFQIFIGCLLSLIFFISNKKTSHKVSYFSYNFEFKNTFHYFPLFFLFLFLAPPILFVIVDALEYFDQADFSLLLKSTFNSFFLSFFISLLSLVISYFLLKINFMINFISILFLIFPLIVFCGGLNLFFTPDRYLSIFFLIIVNSLTLIPYYLRFLKEDIYNLKMKYKDLSQMLNINNFNYFYFIEWKSLKSVFLNAFSFSFVLALGDFAVIKSFPGSEILTLPLYLSQQLSSYRINQASFTALILMILSFLIFRIFYDKNK